MQKVVTNPMIEGALEEFLHKVDEHGYSEQILKAFGGKSHHLKPQFRIPAADVKTEIFFNNRELLSRFANLPLRGQEVFLQGVRKLMEREDVKEIHLSIEWSSTKIRTLRITAPTQIHDQLDIDLI
jgi:hypothetical protein